MRRFKTLCLALFISLGIVLPSYSFTKADYDFGLGCRVLPNIVVVMPSVQISWLHLCSERNYCNTKAFPFHVSFADFNIGGLCFPQARYVINLSTGVSFYVGNCVINYSLGYGLGSGMDSEFRMHLTNPPTIYGLNNSIGLYYRISGGRFRKDKRVAIKAEEDRLAMEERARQAAPILEKRKIVEAQVKEIKLRYFRSVASQQVLAATLPICENIDLSKSIIHNRLDLLETNNLVSEKKVNFVSIQKQAEKIDELCQEATDTLKRGELLAFDLEENALDKAANLIFQNERSIYFSDYKLVDEGYLNRMQIRETLDRIQIRFTVNSSWQEELTSLDEEAMKSIVPEPILAECKNIESIYEKIKSLLDLATLDEEVHNILYQTYKICGWSENYILLIFKNEVCIGMNKEQVKQSLGEPCYIFVYVTPTIIIDQWDYPGTHYYFKNGILNHYQTDSLRAPVILDLKSWE